MKAYIGIDVGNPGGDHTALAVRCTCSRLCVVTWPAEVACQPISFHCPCGKVTRLNEIIPIQESAT